MRDRRARAAFNASMFFGSLLKDREKRLKSSMRKRFSKSFPQYVFSFISKICCDTVDVTERKRASRNINPAFNRHVLSKTMLLPWRLLLDDQFGDLVCKCMFVEPLFHCFLYGVAQMTFLAAE